MKRLPLLLIPLNGSFIYVSDCLPGVCVYNRSCFEIKQHLDVSVSMCMCVCMCEYMYEYVSHAPLSSPLGFEFWCPSFSSSTANWTQWTFCCLHSPPPPAHSVSIYLSHTLSCSSILPLSLSYFLSPSPSSSLQYISFSHALTLSCVLSLFSRNLSSVSLYNCASLYLPLQIKTYSDSVFNCVRFRQRLRVSLLGLSLRCVARERDTERRSRQREWSERCKWEETDVGAFQTFKDYTCEDEGGITIDIILIPNLHLLLSAVFLLHMLIISLPSLPSVSLSNTNTLIPSGSRKSNRCCVVSPLLPTLDPFCQLQLSPTADC